MAFPDRVIIVRDNYVEIFPFPGKQDYVAAHRPKNGVVQIYVDRNRIFIPSEACLLANALQFAEFLAPLMELSDDDTEKDVLDRLNNIFPAAYKTKIKE